MQFTRIWGISLRRGGAGAGRTCVVIGALVATVASALGAQEQVTRLTSTGARNGQAFWSPDGSRVSFVSDRDSGWQVWVMSPTGSNPRRLTTEERPVGWPSWSRDGDSIFFYGQREGAYRLLRISTASGQAVRFDGSDMVAFRPLLHPARDLLLFDAVDGPKHLDHEIYVRNLTNQELTRLTHDPGYDSDARWSPDGASIVFHSDRGAERFQTQVFVMSSTGSDVRQLTQGAGVAGYPSWSRNGRCIVHTVEVAGNRDLWVVGVDGSEPRRLTFHPGLDSEPVWSPGGRVLFSTDRFGGVELAYLELAEDLVQRCDA